MPTHAQAAHVIIEQPDHQHLCCESGVKVEECRNEGFRFETISSQLDQRWSTRIRSQLRFSFENHQPWRLLIIFPLDVLAPCFNEAANASWGFQFKSQCKSYFSSTMSLRFVVCSHTLSSTLQKFLWSNKFIMLFYSLSSSLSSASHLAPSKTFLFHLSFPWNTRE